MSNKHKAKGDALEKAVSLIQEAILKSDPRYAGTEFTVERNVIQTVGGVRHEIDVLVKTLAKSIFEATWLFECKNWNKPVGKDEIIVFSEKVKALGATKGYFVAKKLTKDAEAQIKSDRRLESIPFIEEFLSEAFNLQLLHREHIPIVALLYMRERHGVLVDNPRAFEWKDKPCRWFNQPYSFEKFIHAQVERIIRDDLKENFSKYNIVESSHYGVRKALVQLGIGEFIVGDYEVEEMTVEVPFWVTHRRLKIVSKFELKNRGRYVSFEPYMDGDLGQEIQIDVAHRI